MPRANSNDTSADPAAKSPTVGPDLGNPIAVPDAMAAVPEPATDASLNAGKRSLGARAVESPGADGFADPEAYTGPVIEVYRVTYRRDETFTGVVDVPEYEIKVLELVHGPEAISVSEDPVDELQLITSDPDQEYQRLYAKYERKNVANPVAAVYTPDKLAEEMGLEVKRNRSRRTVQPKASEQINHKTGVRT